MAIQKRFIISDHIAKIYARLHSGQTVNSNECKDSELAEAAFMAGNEYDSIDRYQWGWKVTKKKGKIMLHRYKGHVGIVNGCHKMNKKLIAIREVAIDVSPVQNLAAMYRGLKALDEQISQAEIAFGLKAMREQRAIKAVEYEQALARIAPGLQYGEDKFLLALKKNGESYREGNVKIMRSSRTTRAVLTEKFAATFPDLLAKVCKIELTKADALVGKKTMDDFVEKKTTYSYEVMDMEVQ